MIIVNVMGELVNARTAAERLGVDVRTLYAYVSRGALRRVPGPDGRSSRYDSDELELLARRSRPRTLPRPTASIDLVIATRVSTVTDGTVRYRGIDVLDLAEAEEPFERVADLLWQADRPVSDQPVSDQPVSDRPVSDRPVSDRPVSDQPVSDGPVSDRPASDQPASDQPASDGPASGPAWRLPTAGERPAFPLPREIPVLQRFAVAVAAMPGPGSPAGTASGDTASDVTAGPSTLDPDWPGCGRRTIGCLIDASGPACRNRDDVTNAERVDHANHADDAERVDHADHAGPVARRLWQRWSPLRPTAARVRALDLALVLLAEHELALSTLSVRVAASARATPAGCLLAGLGTLSGSLHGGAARTVHDKLAAREPVVTGFGHPVHRHGDPRVTPLLDAVYAFSTPADRALIETARREAPRPLNVDFALGALTYTARMPAEAATAIFAIARVAGWIAHAAEEYDEPPLRFRGRAS